MSDFQKSILYTRDLHAIMILVFLMHTFVFLIKTERSKINVQQISVDRQGNSTRHL